MDMNDYVYQHLMEELWDRRTDASEADAKIRQLLGDTEQLRKERDELRQQIETIKKGFEGCCYACEPVGLLNKQLLKERDEARRMVCEWHRGLRVQHPQDYAKRRGWDCFREDGK